MIAFQGSWGLQGKLFAGVIGPHGHWEFVRTARPGPTPGPSECGAGVGPWGGRGEPPQASGPWTHLWEASLAKGPLSPTMQGPSGQRCRGCPEGMVLGA